MCRKKNLFIIFFILFVGSFGHTKGLSLIDHTIAPPLFVEQHLNSGSDVQNGFRDTDQNKPASLQIQAPSNSLWAWGRNNFGQLGDGTNTNSLIPIEVTELIDIVSAEAGYYHTSVLKTDGSVWAWGQNTYGQLGNGTNINQTSPIKALGLPKIVALSSGTYHVLALDCTGNVWAWGYNGYGQLGDDTTNNRSEAVKVHNRG